MEKIATRWMRHRATTRSLNIKSHRGRREQHHDSAPTDNSSTASEIRSHFLLPQDVARDSPRIELIRAHPFDPCLKIGSNPAETNDSSGLPDCPGSADDRTCHAACPGFRAIFLRDKDYAESELYFVVSAPEV
jgi:hypothetical protein